MLVEEIMNRNVATLMEENTLNDALNLLRDHDIRHVPVIDEEGYLIGIVTDRDIRSACPSYFDSDFFEKIKQIKIREIMKTNVITCFPLDFVEESALTMYENRIGCMPVIQNNQLVGIITESDVLHTLLALTGINQPSSQIEIKFEDKPGIVSDILNIIGQKNVNIVSILIYPSKEPFYKILTIRVQTINPLELIQYIKSEGYDVLWPSL
ncbi:MAG: acetoin utilization AcuB family protein [Bacillaceae bacterium]